MSKKIGIWFLILATAVIVLPPAGNAAAPAENNGISVYESYANSLFFQGRGRGRKRGNRSWNRYKPNRGRYISARNRRYRLMRKYYWRDGVRRYRLVRIYY